ncbi:MAG: aminotransferase class I/II-fold pyridoxal phosphate-dependent enzyme [Paracoccaceae bacterium]
MRLSQRISDITGGGSDGWDVFYRARDMVASGTPVIELTIGEHDIRTDPSVLEAMHRSAMGGHTGYAVVPGEIALRKAVAERVTARTGVPTTAENVLITPGGQSALFTAHHAVCDEGDTALYCDPYYATYPGTIRAVGARPRPIVTRPEDSFQPTAKQIGAAADGARSLLINSPNNPTGVVYRPDTVEAVARACVDHNLWLISDEVYDTQIWDGAHLSPRALPGMSERTLVVGSMSKSHAMTGSRVGWLIGPKHVISAAIDLATHMTYGVPGYIQDAALFALNAGPALETEIAAPFKRRRLLAERVLAGQNIVRPVPSSGAMYLMLDIRATGLSGEAFATSLLERHHIAVMPGESFGQAAQGHLRVAMTVDDSRFEAALEKLVALAQEHAS